MKKKKEQTIFMPLDGTIKFKLDHSYEEIEIGSIFYTLNPFRETLWGKKLVGVYPSGHPDGGIGFGNVSQRLSTSNSFVISGTQTGVKESLEITDYSLVTSFDLNKGMIYSKGLTKPSSEALTHAAIYLIAPEVQFVFHIHSLFLWEKSQILGLLTTDKEAQYGSLELVKAIQEVYNQNKKAGLISLLGHKEGLLIWGEEGKKMINQITTALS